MKHGSELLADWLAEKDMQQAAFAKLAGLSRQRVCDYISLRMSPTLEKALSIEDATSGAVPARSWISK